MLRSLFSIAPAVRVPLTAALSLTIALAACSDDPTQPPAVVPTGASPITFGEAAIGVTEASYDFGKVALGDSTAIHGYTIMNVGIAPLSISNIFIGNFVGGTFQYVWDFPNRCNYTVSIPPGGTCAVPFYFKPTYAGPSSMDITVHSNGGDVTFKAVGTAFMPAVVSPNEVYFAEQGLGSESTRQSVRITNTGPSAIVLENLTFAGDNPGDFRLSIANSGGCQLGGKIAPAASCDVALTFVPTAVGRRTATLSIETNAGKIAAYVYGTGVEAADVSLGMTGVLQGKSIIYSLTVKNAGPNGAANIFLVDALPAGTTLAGITYPTGVMTCDAPAVGGSGTLKCLIASLASGASTSLQFTVKAAATTKGSVTNTATATSMSLDPFSGNNGATVTTSLGRK